MAKDKSKGSGGSKAISDNERFTSLPEPAIAGGKVTKRAEEVFNREYTQTRRLAKDAVERGEYNVSGYNTLHSDDNEPVFTKPVLKGITTKINSEFNGMRHDVELGVLTPRQAMTRRYALTMLQNMVNRYYRGLYRGD